MDFNSYCNMGFAFLCAITGFCFLIVIHELGHFLFAKLFGINTPTFSIGLGPKIIEKKIWGTNFRLSAIPLGGYCEIAGLTEVGQGEQQYSKADDHTAFRSKAYWQKFLVLMGGILFNLIFAYIAFIISFMIGKPKSDIVVVKSVIENSVAYKNGIKEGDIILKLGDTDVKQSPKLLFKEIQKIATIPPEEKYKISILRNDNTENIEVSFQEKPEDTSSQKGKLGVVFDFQPSSELEKLSFKQAVVEGIKTTHEWIMFTFFSIKNIFVSKQVKGAGPVMIIAESIKKAQKGFVYLLMFLAIISINLALFNLLPLPVLDGGQLLFATVEAIIRREISESIKIIIFVSSWALLITMFIVFTYQDIKHLFGL